MLRSARITAVGTLLIAPNGGGAQLWSVNINKGAAGALLSIYNDVSAVAGSLVATIDCANPVSLWYGIGCEKGIFVAMSVGNADVTIGYR